MPNRMKVLYRIFLLLLFFLGLTSASKAVKKQTSFLNLVASSSSSSESESEAIDTFDESASFDDEMAALMHQLAIDPDWFDRQTPLEEPFVTVQRREKKRSGSASDSNNRRSGSTTDWTRTAESARTRTRSGSISDYLGTPQPEHRGTPLPGARSSSRLSDRETPYGGRSSSRLSDRDTPGKFARDFDTPGKFSNRTTPASKYATPSPASTGKQTPSLFSPPTAFSPPGKSPFKVKHVQALQVVSFEEAWQAAERIPGINPRLFRLDVEGMIIMSPKYNRFTNFDFKYFPNGTFHSYANVRFDPGDVELYKTLNIIQVALLGFINNNEEEADLTCWVPCQLHQALWQGDKTAVYWYKRLYLNNKSRAAGSMAHEALFGELGVELRKPRLASVDGEGAFEDNFVFREGRVIPTCTALRILE